MTKFVLGYKVMDYGILVFRNVGTDDKEPAPIDLNNWRSILGVVAKTDIEKKHGKIASIDEEKQIVKFRNVFGDLGMTFRELVGIDEFGCWAIGIFVTEKYFVTATMCTGDDKIFAINKTDYSECHIISTKEIGSRFNHRQPKTDLVSIRVCNGDIALSDEYITIPWAYKHIRDIEISNEIKKCNW